MTTWFIRIGSKKHISDMNLYQFLAEKHSVIMIGYDIEKDITKEDRDGIKNYLMGRSDLTSGQIPILTTLIHRFVNEISKGELVISPFKKTSENFQIGIIESNCERVDSFFSNQNTLQALINMTDPNASQNPVEPKPARKVRWEYKDVPLNQLPPQLQQAMNNYKHMRPTTNKLAASGTINFSSLGAYQVGKGLGSNFIIS